MVQMQYVYEMQRYQIWCLPRIFSTLTGTLTTAPAIRKDGPNNTNMYQHSSHNGQETHARVGTHWGQQMQA